jgi:hypothetical protein
MQIVLITWVDAIGGDGWLSLQDLKQEKPHEHHSLGFIAHETDQFITIAMSYDEDEENMGAWLCIPKAYIKNIINVTPSEKLAQI